MRSLRRAGVTSLIKGVLGAPEPCSCDQASACVWELLPLAAEPLRTECLHG